MSRSNISSTHCTRDKSSIKRALYAERLQSVELDYNSCFRIAPIMVTRALVLSASTPCFVLAHAHHSGQFPCGGALNSAFP
jgi:hypothetical protein